MLSLATAIKHEREGARIAIISCLNLSMKLHSVVHSDFVKHRIATKELMAEAARQELRLVASGFQSQFGQPSPLFFINSFLGKTPQSEIGTIEAVAQIVAFLAYLDPFLGHLRASLIAIAATRLACSILKGFEFASDEELKLAENSLDARFPPQDALFRQDADRAQQRLKKVLTIAFNEANHFTGSDKDWEVKYCIHLQVVRKMVQNL